MLSDTSKIQQKGHLEEKEKKKRKGRRELQGEKEEKKELIPCSFEKVEGDYLLPQC